MEFSLFIRFCPGCFKTGFNVDSVNILASLMSSAWLRGKEGTENWMQVAGSTPSTESKVFWLCSQQQRWGCMSPIVLCLSALEQGVKPVNCPMDAAMWPDFNPDLVTHHLAEFPPDQL